MAIAGVIAERAQAIIPITWDALESDSRVGDTPLQSAINLAKAVVTGQVVDPTQENLYPLIVIDYIAKAAVVEITQAGIDFWMNQSINLSATGTNENLVYTDRAQRLAALRADLVTETRQKQPEIQKLVNYYIDNGHAVPQMSSANINPFHLTPSPEEFPRPYRQTQYS